MRRETRVTGNRRDRRSKREGDKTETEKERQKR